MLLPADHDPALHRRPAHGGPSREGTLMTADKPTTDRANAAIDVQDLHKYFGDNEVLKGIDFHVDNGQVVCVIGPSGSGKSTLLRCVNLLEQPTSGRILIEGTEITDPDVNVDKVRSRIGMVFQSFNLFPHLTVAAQPDHRPAERSRSAASTRPSRSPAATSSRSGSPTARTPTRPTFGRPAAAHRDRPGAVDGPRHDAVRRADQRPRPGAGRRRARRDEVAGRPRA